MLHLTLYLGNKTANAGTVSKSSKASLLTGKLHKIASHIWTQRCHEAKHCICTSLNLQWWKRLLGGPVLLKAKCRVSPRERGWKEKERVEDTQRHRANMRLTCSEWSWQQHAWQQQLLLVLSGSCHLAGDTSLFPPEEAYLPCWVHRACSPWLHGSSFPGEAQYKVAHQSGHASGSLLPSGSWFLPFRDWGSWHWAWHCSLAAWDSLLQRQRGEGWRSAR